MAKTKKELKEEEIGEQVEVEVKQPLDKIVPIRLSADHWAELYRYAHELGIGPTTLARMWILEKLALYRAYTSPSYARSGGPWFRSWVTPALRRLTFDQFMEEWVATLPDDVKQRILEFVEESMIPPGAENPEDVKHSLEELAERSVLSPQQFVRAFAGYFGIEIVEEEAEAKEPKVEA